jgi:SAM-dependent methyltransferase
MPEQSWGEGYVVDLDYTHGYYRDLAPALLRFVALLGGVRAVDIEPAFTYYELGCGHGFSTALHAAANPSGQFIGADFNPSHIQSAQILARDAGIANVRFLEKSFAELLEMELPDAEIIGLHGVWTWVGDEQRRQIVEFIRRRLKPGGMVYLSYNCLPGLAQVAPLQRLLAEHAALGAGDRIEQIRRSIDFASRLEKAGAKYFAVSPFARGRLQNIGAQDPNYVAHEYYNANWSLQYHADVARALAAAKLGFVGSTMLLDNFEQFVLAPEAAKLLAELKDRALLETAKDFMRNQVFRKDVFARGAPQATPGELVAVLGRTRFALVQPRSRCKLAGSTPAGEVALSADAYAPVLDALARAPMTFDELARAPETSGLDRNRLRQAVFGVAALGNILPALPAAGEEARRAATRRFNRTILAAPAQGPANSVLASPVLGCGINIHFIDRLFLEAPQDEKQAAAHVASVMARRGLKLAKGKEFVQGEGNTREVLAERARLFFEELVPFYRQLGVLD